MFIVVPTGRIKRVMRRSTFKFSSKQRKVTGNVAALVTKQKIKKIETQDEKEVF